MAKGNRSLVAKAMKHSQDRRYGGRPRATWSLDKTEGNFAPRGYTMPSDKQEVPAYDDSQVRRVGMVRESRQRRATIGGIELVAWCHEDRALTMRQNLRQHF